MKIIDSRISKSELNKHLGYFKTMIKAVVDVRKCILAIDAELHSDLEAGLLDNGSLQEDIWGINLYPLKDKENLIEWTSLINIRPHQDNFSMEVENLEIKKKITHIVHDLIEYES